MFSHEKLLVYCKAIEFVSWSQPLIETLPKCAVRDQLDRASTSIPLNIAEATLGGVVLVPTLSGPVHLTVPAGTASGRKLRLRGKGVEDAQGRVGDLYAVVKIVPPEGGRVTDDEGAALKRIAERFPIPRGGPEWPSGG